MDDDNKFTMSALARNESISHKAIMVFSADLARKLPTTEVRLPPTYVGVRRVRPSNFAVRQVLHASSKRRTPTNDPVHYKVIDEATGQERRMNRKEKRALKQKMKEQQKQAKLAAAAQMLADNTKCKSSNDDNVQPSNDETMSAREDAPSIDAMSVEPKSSDVQISDADASNLFEESDSPNSSNKSSRAYLQLKINPAALEQELADLRGERNGVPPVALCPAMAKIACTNQMFANASAEISIGAPHEKLRLLIDDEMAKQWADAIKQSMRFAEDIRSQENMRPMPYTITPETWERFRPELSKDIMFSPNGADTELKALETTDWSPCIIRPSASGGCKDMDHAIVIEALHHDSGLHMACGSKFGCDFLVYDGPRQERHAFAGLRILTGSDTFPIPTAYDLAGYVRCLNTAGKLALLATVRHEGAICRVAVVDLALEKILQTSHKRKRKTLEERKKNLSKVASA